MWNTHHTSSYTWLNWNYTHRDVRAFIILTRIYRGIQYCSITVHNLVCLWWLFCQSIMNNTTVILLCVLWRIVLYYRYSNICRLLSVVLGCRLVFEYCTVSHTHCTGIQMWCRDTDTCTVCYMCVEYIVYCVL